MAEVGAIVGVLIRVDPERRRSAEATLEALEGVSTLEVGVHGTLGALIEAVDPEAAHARLRNELLVVPGVRAAWPVDLRLVGEERESSEDPAHASRTS